MLFSLANLLGVKELFAAISKGAVKHLKAQGGPTSSSGDNEAVKTVKKRSRCEIF